MRSFLCRGIWPFGLIAAGRLEFVDRGSNVFGPTVVIARKHGAGAMTSTFLSCSGYAGTGAYLRGGSLYFFLMTLFFLTPRGKNNPYMSILGEEYSRRAPAVRKPRLGIKTWPAISRIQKDSGRQDEGSARHGVLGGGQEHPENPSGQTCELLLVGRTIPARAARSRRAGERGQHIPSPG
jgi:hypothetical protein